VYTSIGTNSIRTSRERGRSSRHVSPKPIKKRRRAYDSVVGLLHYLEELGVIIPNSTNSVTKAMVMAKKTPVGDEAMVTFLRNMEIYLVRRMNLF